ncbi:MAG TPA: adenosylmethionine--8-amino-7-oxononanoate transaminase [Candidatus Limnocylindria bacterium]|jgi:adenosylmethionine-8-amino-7-oxononanoate aminotransferase|nr:adenosylmethionine--8-amino-7-oxononanoate transaminase [Candidatus Limnocylindria bacterium]
MHPLAQLDHAHVWHPFTQMQDWLQREPIVLVGGEGTQLYAADGKVYLDANSSIWTNLHGHREPRLNRAMERQLAKVAHTSSLGFANEPASLLAAELVQAANPSLDSSQANPSLGKVFYSDSGSTAVEVALKLAYQHAIRRDISPQPRFLALEGAYHGDTVGAVSLGHIDLFHESYRGLLFKSDRVMAPYCYRCPYNRAQPERGDARLYRQCQWECVGEVERKVASAAGQGHPYAGFIFEPRMQGAAGMVPQPDGWLARVGKIARQAGTLLIADEVMTGFGRTGNGNGPEPLLFASHHEGIQPDFMALAKGLTGGYMPMAATLTTQAVFASFLGRYDEFKTFFHGHSYTGNQLGAAVGLESLNLLREPAHLARRQHLEKILGERLQRLWKLAAVGDVRQAGLVAGIELVKDWRTREPYALAEQAGIRVCEAMAKQGVLTRPIGSIIVLMPPYCTTDAELERMVEVIETAIREVLGSGVI